MKTVSRYEELAPLISAQFRRGVRTNAFFDRGELERLIGRGELCAQSTPAGLLLLVRRPDFSRLHFYLNDLSAPLVAELPGAVVCEIAFRPRDTGLQEAADWLCAQGFSPLLSRVRLSRAPGAAPAPEFPLRTPEDGERGRLWSFLQEMFDPLTGCVPTLEEFESDRCLFLEGGAEPAGLIHFVRGRRGGEIRHLAVHPDRRGRGLSRQLIAGCLQALEGGPCTVWTGADNTAALRAYGAMGFQADDWRSAVLGKMT